MHAAAQIANRFLDLAQADNGRPLTPMQLIKLVYIAHGWMLGLYSRQLIRDEIQAWKYGPVIPELYKHVAAFRGDPITGRLSEPASQILDDTADDLIQQVYAIYGHRSGGALSSLTHQPGSPWAQMWDPNKRAIQIPDEVIKRHYESLVAKYGER